MTGTALPPLKETVLENGATPILSEVCDFESAPAAPVRLTWSNWFAGGIFFSLGAIALPSLVFIVCSYAIHLTR